LTCATVLDLGLGARNGDIERPLVDGEQKVVLFHRRAVDEIHLIDEARNARTDLNGFHRDEAA
jgi:hypothetical protein